MFKTYGVKRIVGIDGSYVKENRLYIKPAEFIAHDLIEPIELNEKFDLAISLEVAEHLPKKVSKSFVDLLCEHSDIILFSAAHKNQGGTNHINEQPIAYWSYLFSKNGYVHVDCIRPCIWGNGNIPSWYRSNIMLYVRSTSISSDTLMSIMKEIMPLGAVTSDALDISKIKLGSKGLGLLAVLQINIIKAIFPSLFRTIKRRI